MKAHGFRNKLGAYINREMWFVGDLVSVVTKGHERHLLIRNLRLVNSDEVLADHIWVIKRRAKPRLEPGKPVEFFARVTQYAKRDGSGGFYFKHGLTDCRKWKQETGNEVLQIVRA